MNQVIKYDRSTFGTLNVLPPLCQHHEILSQRDAATSTTFNHLSTLAEAHRLDHTGQNLSHESQTQHAGCINVNIAIARYYSLEYQGEPMVLREMIKKCT